ncbi:MAG: hypothetical protein V4635_06550 [Bacteroidota bacterium]
MKKINLYIGLTTGLVLIAVLATYYLTSINAGQNKARGYAVTTYAPPTCVDPDYLNKLRAYQTFSLTSDTTTNNQTIALMRSYLNNLKKSGDSLNGVHVIMTNDMPYKYYLKSVEVFNELPPAIFFTLDNNFYAINKSKYRMTQDSIEVEASRIPVIDL